MVSGLTQSDGDGDRSRLVVMWPRPSRPAEWPSESLRWPASPVVWAKWDPGRPSGMLFSDRNSSRSAYCDGKIERQTKCGDDKIYDEEYVYCGLIIKKSCIN